MVGTVLVVKRLVRLPRASFAVDVWACIWLAMLRMGEVKLGKVDSSRGDWGLRKRRSSGRSPRPLAKAMVFYLRRSQTSASACSRTSRGRSSLAVYLRRAVASAATAGPGGHAGGRRREG